MLLSAISKISFVLKIPTNTLDSVMLRVDNLLQSKIDSLPTQLPILPSSNLTTPISPRRLQPPLSLSSIRNKLWQEIMGRRKITTERLSTIKMITSSIPLINSSTKNVLSHRRVTEVLDQCSTIEICRRRLEARRR